MDELKMSIEEMISMLDGAAGRLIVASMENTTIKEAMEMVTNVSISLGEWATDGLPQNRWIPVTERLPEVGEEFVLVCVNGRYHNIKFAGAAEIAMYDEEGWWIEAYPEWKNPRVTHWMPMPDAPKEEDNG